MIPIAVVLLIIVVVFSVGLVIGNPAGFTISIFRAQISVNSAGVYFTGAGAMLVLILAFGLLRVGLRRSLAKRKQVQALRQAAGGVAPAKPARAKPAPPVTRSTGATATSAPANRPVTVEPVATRPGTPPAPEPVATTTAAERQALLDEADELSGDDPQR